MTDTAGPPWTIEASGHTERGWPWYRVRKRGGQLLRITLHGARATPGDTLDAINTAVDRLPARPGPNVF